MATRKTVTTVETESGASGEGKDKIGEEIVITGEVDSVEQDLIAELLAAGIEEEITYAVRRVSPADKASYCTKYSRGDLSLDRIREDWGPGTYAITAFDAANKYRKRTTVKIAESLKAAPVVASQTSQLAEMAQILRANVPTSAPQGTDMTAVLVAMMKSQSDLLTAILTRPAPASPPAPDPLAMIAALRDVLKPQKESSEVDILLKGLSLGKDLAGGSEWTDVVAKGLDAVVPLLNSQSATSTTRPAVRSRPIPNTRQLPKSAPQTEAPVGEAPATEGADGGNMQIVQKLQWLSRQAMVLCRQAAAQKDPELYAEVFLDNLPEFFTLDEVHERLNQPDAVDELGKIHAPVLQYREWFEKFRVAALDMIAEEGEDDPAGTVIDSEASTVRRPGEKTDTPET